jgi:hypothetical protein
MGLTTNDLWDVDQRGISELHVIGEDIESHSNYPLTLTRCTAPTAWLLWTCLSLRGEKTRPTCNKSSRPLEVKKNTEEKEWGPRDPAKG